MSKPTTQPVNVPFYDHSLLTMQDGETIRVAMKPICDAIGLQWEAQFKRIKRHAVLSQGMSMMDIPSGGGVQRFTTLPLDMLNGWLFGVEVKRVKPEVRDALLMYQRECFQALADYWQKGIAINPRIPLTPDHQRGIQKAVARKAQSLPKPVQRLAFSKLYSHLKDKFSVGTYKEIGDNQYTEALGAIQAYELEGEWLTLEPQGDAVFSDNDLNDLYILLCHVHWIYRHWSDYRMDEALQLLHSPAAAQMYEHMSMADTFKSRLARSKGELLEASRERLGLNYGIIPIY